VFDATKAMPEFRDIQFQQFNKDEPDSASMVERYKVGTIPRLIYLDGSSNVIHDQTGGFFTAQDFGYSITHPK